MLRRHLESGGKTNSYDRSKDTLNTTSCNQNTQPVWVKTSILNEHFPSHSVQDDDDCTITSVSTVDTTSSRRFGGRSRKRNECNRAANRSATGWGWVFGYADLPTKTDPHTTPLAKNRKGHIDNNGNNTVSSPFGQYSLRKTSRTVYDESTEKKRQDYSKPLQEQHPRTVTVQDKFNTTYNGLTITLSPAEVSENMLLANVYDDTSGPPQNLIDLTHLHEPTLVQSLQERYDMDKVYTFCGSILLALNPFQEMKGLYDEARMIEYWNLGDNDVSTLEPHVYSVAHKAYRDMKDAFKTMQESRFTNKVSDVTIDQSILVSGESGAGKTVTTKIVMKYLAALSQQSVGCDSTKATSSNSMEQQVLQSNPILESFGNARTVRNDNSSRFGKFIEIQFGTSGCLMGASIKTYLLEKVRLISQTEGERNFHIFYELLNGLRPRDREREPLGLVGFTLDDFRITAISRTYDRRDGVKDSTTYRDLRSAMKTVGFSQEEQIEIFQVASGLLHFSNLNFIEAQSDGSTLDKTNRSLDFVLNLFGVQYDCLNDALTTFAIDVNKMKIRKHLNIEKAELAMEGLMKATYGALFNYIVKRVNQSIRVGSMSDEEESHRKENEGKAFIKILDIFGFESFEHNSFEQLCINYCNEALQQQFNKFVFKLEQQEYEKENIAWSFITWPDNQDVLDLIEKRHSGIFSILDDQAKLVKCTDQSFATAVYQKCDDHARFHCDRRQKARGLFSIKHYAGPVEYSSASFLDKNKDELPKELTDVLLSSSTITLQKLGKLLSVNQASNKSGGRALRVSSSISRATVGSQFVAQLSDLRKTIDRTAPHYIRCLKPNDDLTPNNFVSAVIADQLRCAGVLEAVRVSRTGYPQRYTKDHFVDRYSVLGINAIEKARRYRNRDICEALVESVVSQVWERQQMINRDTQRTNFDHVSVGIQLGKSKVFLRHFAFNALEYLRSQKLDFAATKIQSIFRMFRHREFYRYTLQCTLIVQSCFRRYSVQKRIRLLKQNGAAIVIQKIWRGYNEYSNFSLVLYVTSWCQRMYRGNKDRVRFLSLQQDRAAIIIQSRWRQIMKQSKYRRMYSVVITLQQLQRAKMARTVLRNLKLEAKDLSHVMKERDELKRKHEQMKMQLLEAEKVQKVMEEAEHLREEVEKLKKEIQRLRPIEECSLRKEEEIKHLKSIINQMKNKANQSLTTNIIDSEKFSAELDSELTFSAEDSISGDLSFNHIMRSGNFDTPIHTAIRTDDGDGLSIAVSASEDVIADINRGGFDGKTPLHLAVLNDNVSSVEILLQNHSVSNAQDHDGNTPLHYATNHAMTALLVQHNANPNIPNSIGVRPLHAAVQRRDLMSVKCLLDNEANVQVADDESWLTPLHLIMKMDEDEFHNKPETLSDSSSTVEIAKLLCSASVKTGADMNYQDRNGNTPLHFASILVSQDAGDLISLLLRQGANPNLKNNRGQAPTHLLLHNDELRSNGTVMFDLVHLMLHFNADPNITSMSGCTPLHLAIYHQDYFSATELVSKGAQLHLPWTKPARWKSHWNDEGLMEVTCLDMIEDKNILYRILSAITGEQTKGTIRSKCMHCKKKIGPFSRQYICDHCGSNICGQCSTNDLEKSYLPHHRESFSSDHLRVCKICKDILISRKHEQSIMGREVYAIHSQDEDVSFLDMDTSFQHDDF